MKSIVSLSLAASSLFGSIGAVADINEEPVPQAALVNLDLGNKERKERPSSSSYEILLASNVITSTDADADADEGDEDDEEIDLEETQDDQE
jgi:hypothetical protein